MFIPNKVKEIRTELSEIVILLNAKEYSTALACVSQASTLLTKLGREIQERSQTNGKESRDTTGAERGEVEA